MKPFTAFNRLLGVFFIFIAALIMTRMFYSGSIRYIFIVWNIFLAWIPYVLSDFFVVYRQKEKWKQLFLFASWLLFFPNALYIVTDLIHLEANTNVPVWYDAILLFASSFVGLIMAFISLQKVEYFLKEIFSRRTIKMIIPLILFIGSFGVYLGRFQRWNSWDVVHNPLALAMDILHRFTSPVDNYKTWAITLILTALYSLLYFCIKILPNAFAESKTNLEIK
ncbi:MAG: DUF1361 domain-containing protein [Ferruginibacter sp.]